MEKGSSSFVGSIPEHYDAYLGPRIFDGFAEDLCARVAATGARSVLELAAGTGILSRKILDAMPQCNELVVTDLNSPMLEHAQAKFSDGEPVEFRAADALELPFPEDAFDCISCQFGVMFFPDKARSFVEAFRVLKPGGQYLFNVWEAWAHNDFARVAHEAVAAFFPDDPPGFYKVPFGYRDTGEITATLEGAGFTGINHETVVLESAIPSAHDFATGLVFGNPLYDEVLSRQGDPGEVRDAVAIALAEELGEHMTLRAIVIDAAKQG